MKYWLLLITVLLSLPSIHAKEIRLDYEGYTLWLNCEKKAAVRFRYNAQRDTGDFKRVKTFFLDKDVPENCRQISTGSYKEQGIATRYDRGHQVPANHLDHSQKAIRQSNYMNNILPQIAQMNRGAWYQTEEITECYRDIDELLILGGAWWDDEIDSRFLLSHGLPDVPDVFWKVIIRQHRIIAWWIPNSSLATKGKIDEYLVTPGFIQKMTGIKLPVSVEQLESKPQISWYIPVGCNKG